ncbi:MAG: hypothetical protein JKP98_14730, partial [Rhodobacteraceae bacterium]|nr:hypothetical protein [Paracoccaceae bacterium]
MLFTGHNLVVPKARLRRDIDHDAFLVITAVCCLQVGRNGAFDDVAVASGFSNRWRNRWQLASGSVRQSFLNARARARIPLGVIGLLHRIEMARDPCIHTDIRPDQTGIDADRLGRNKPGQPALLHNTDKDPAKDVFAPALADARQRGMIRQGLVQRVA